MLSFVILSVVMLIVSNKSIMLSVVRLNVVMLSVVARYFYHEWCVTNGS